MSTDEEYVPSPSSHISGTSPSLLHSPNLAIIPSPQPETLISNRQKRKVVKGSSSRNPPLLLEEPINTQPPNCPKLQRWFSSPQQMLHFSKFFASRQLAKDQVFDFDWFIDVGFTSFIPFFEKAQLLQFLSIRAPIYPELVRAFFSTFQYNPRRRTASAFVKGIHIKLNGRTWTQLSGLHWTGVNIPFTISGAISVPLEWANEYNFNSSLQTLIRVGCDLPDIGQDVPAGLLTMDARILHLALTHNIFGKGGNYSKVKNNERLCLWALLKNKDVNWANLVLSHWKFVAHIDHKKKRLPPLPSSMLITRILAHFGVDFTDEIEQPTYSRFYEIGETTLAKGSMEQLEDGTWIIQGVGAASNVSLDKAEEYYAHLAATQPITPTIPITSAEPASSSNSTLLAILAKLEAIEQRQAKNHSQVLKDFSDFTKMSEEKMKSLSDNITASINTHFDTFHEHHQPPLPGEDAWQDDLDGLDFNLSDFGVPHSPTNPNIPPPNLPPQDPFP